jgi:hypothetical protein
LDYLPFARPTIDEAMIAAVSDTLRGRWIASGPQVQAFERALGDYVGGRPVRSLTSATAAMQVALEMLEVGPGDEVITPAQSFFATANVIERTGATTVFVDVELASRNLDFAQADAAVTPRTKVLLPTHYNAPIDPAALAGFAQRPQGARARGCGARHRLPRGRQARGRGRRPGVVQLPSEQEHDHHRRGRAGRERRARGAPHRGAALPRHHAQRRRHARRARARLEIQHVRRLGAAWDSSSCAGWTNGAAPASAWRITTSSASPATTSSPPRHFRRATTRGHSWNMFTVLLPLDAARTTRKQFMDAMQKEGIGIGISYEAIHLTRYFRGKGFREGRFPVSERIARETVTLPLFPEMRETDVQRVCESMKRVLRRKAA